MNSRMIKLSVLYLVVLCNFSVIVNADVLQFIPNMGVNPGITDPLDVIRKAEPDSKNPGWRMTWEYQNEWVVGTGWIDYRRRHYTYVVDDFISDVITEQKNSMHVWENTTREQYTYTAEYLINSYTSSTWSNNNWVNVYRTIYSYGAENQIDTSVTQNWSNSIWNDGTRTTYFYNLQGAIDSTLTQSWQTNSWVNSSATKYHYNNQNQTSIVVSYFVLQDVWQPSNMMFYFYDNQGNFEQIDMYSWNTQTQDYNAFYRYLYTYNTLQRVTQVLIQSTGNGIAWSDLAQYIYSYDTNGNQQRVVLQQFNNTWINSLRIDYEFEQYVTPIQDDMMFTQPFSVNLSPNPVNSFALVNVKAGVTGLCELSVYDIKGRRVLSQSLYVQEGRESMIKLETSSLRTGIYLLKTSVAGQNKVNRFLKVL